MLGNFNLTVWVLIVKRLIRRLIFRLLCTDYYNNAMYFSCSFSMTLVDTMDTLAVIGDYDEFERAVKLVIDNVKFDSDIVVSVFETNIRMVG